MAVVWDEDIEATFIEAFRERTCLYDKTDVNFKDKDLKQQAWEEVASKCKVTAAAAKDKRKNLRDSFVRERKKKGGGPSGSAGGALKDPKWVHYRAMSFIEPHLAARKTKSNMDAEAKPDEEQSEEKQMDGGGGGEKQVE
ncbi:hypothetical protein AAVH_28201, partial [Aphelenchoides avenae]